jgi:hypothetical protein
MKPGNTLSMETPIVSEREYLFDMIAQLAKIAAGCGEKEIAEILKKIVTNHSPLASRAVSGCSFNGSKH